MQDEGKSHEAHWQKLVEDLVTNFDEYHTQPLSPSDLICADESISRWYGQGGHWINLWLPMCVAMGKQPQNEEDIHNAAYGKSGIIMWLSIVNYARHEAQQEDE